ncbi:DUF3667 domain-containing protein [Flavobacterium hercynium]|uniref:DUF3667 domain-containing protein n=1 Tax=Flavobacterium hercynium TaxID=387094 RepID=A0A226HC27_9FLAO|nr:DUF3667 domain-containing protein [Flavobacterium hercynium]OXA90980.1 hypothetical protein B0A66_12250 [Flavobacterium hercynium]SMP36462.1 Protein of unknown function [Flavobacterium hercynium]
MSIKCKNCDQNYSGNYCNNCGQPAETHKINAHFLWHDIQHGLLHFDKGILYSFQQLFSRPGHSIREFIEGKRVKHFKPISLVVVLGTLYGILYHFFDINLINATSTDPKINYLKVNEFIATHFFWITIANIPLFTIGTFICFRKQGYNFIEYFVLNTFKASQKLFAHIITFPLLYFFNGSPEIKSINILIYVIDLILIFWTNIQFFNKISKTKALLLSILSHLIFLVLFILILIVIVLLYEHL